MPSIGLANPSIYDNNVNLPTDGELLRADLNTIITQVNTNTTDITTVSSAALTRTDIPQVLTGGPPVWQSVSTILVPALSVQDATNNTMIVLPSSVTINMASTGVINGVDSAEANSTWYYIWIIKGTTGVAAIASASSTSPSISGLTGYNSYKYRLPVAYYNDSSGNLIETYVQGGWPSMPYLETPVNRLVQTNIDGTYATLDISAFVPPLSRRARLYLTVFGGASSGSAQIQVAESSAYSSNLRGTGRAVDGGRIIQEAVEVRTTSSQTIYAVGERTATSGTANSMYAIGYTMTEIY